MGITPEFKVQEFVCPVCDKQRHVQPTEDRPEFLQPSPWTVLSVVATWATPHWQAKRRCACRHLVFCDHRHRHRRTAQACVDKLNRR